MYNTFSVYSSEGYPPSPSSSLDRRSLPSLDFPSSSRLRSSSADTRLPSRPDLDFPSSYRHLQRDREFTPPFQPRVVPSFQESQYSTRDSPPLYGRVVSRSVKERSPPTSTALIDLIHRYPSARNSILTRSPWPSDVPLSHSYSDSAPFSPSNLSTSYSDPFTTSSSDFTPSEESPRSLAQEWPDSFSSTATLKPLDISTLDEVLFDDDMSRSTSEWRNNFERAQQHFRTRPHDSPDQSIFHGFTSNGHSMPRSMAAGETSSLLADAVRRTETERERELAGSRLGAFWDRSLLSQQRATSPTPPRLSSSLTAAERLSMLKEPADNTPTIPRRTDSIASRQTPFLGASRSSPNFAALDRAVAEMTTRVGCGRFPTEDHVFSPPPFRGNPRTNGLHSPSPDSLSDTSSYGVPTGLPHPRPRHNVMEQLAKVTVTTRPNFPITGSVSTRITELEKRPGTPTLRLAGGREEGPPPLSPRSTVFRTKPVIHVDVSRQDEPTATFSFSLSRNGAGTVEDKTKGTTGNNTRHSGVTPLLDRLRLDSPGEPKHTSTPKSKTELNGTNGVEEYMPSPRAHLSFDTSSSSSADSSDSGISRATKGINVSSRLDEDDLKSPQGVNPRWLPRPQVIQHRPINVPRFHFPQGKPVAKSEIDAALRKAGEVFRSLPNSVATLDDMPAIIRAFGLPLYWKRPIWDQVSRGRSRVEQKDFSAWWWNMTTVAHDEAARLVHVLSHGSRSFIVEEDFHSFVLDLIHTHPGLEFYRKSDEFHEKFIQVITTRIFWTVNRSWSGKINANELRRSNLLENIRELERQDDINQMTEFFSYEHFYVIYCKFWDIDTDHDMVITKDDLMRHNDHAIVPLAIDRIFSGAVTRGRSQGATKTRDLVAFTSFLLADEDKNHPTSIEYWFRVVDLDGDGRISLHEMETFYNEIIRMLGSLGIETMSFSDLACNLLDMIEPESGTDFTLADLKRSPLAGRFFNSFVNWRKFYTQESSDGEKTCVKGNGEEELTDWERYCMEEYELMMENDENDEVVDDSYSVILDD